MLDIKYINIIIGKFYSNANKLTYWELYISRLFDSIYIIITCIIADKIGNNVISNKIGD